MSGPWLIGSTVGLDLPYVDVRQFGSIDVADHTALFNLAAAGMPIGGTLYLPKRTYVLSGTGPLVTISRHFNILGDGAIIRADGADTTTDMFYVQVTDAGGYADVRQQRIEGIRAFFNGSGRHVVLVHAAGAGALPQNGFTVFNSQLNGGTGGAAIFFAGEVHSGRVLECDISDGIEFGVYAGSDPPADAQRVEKCLIYGTRTGIRLRAQVGSFSHTIKDNVIVSRDGAIEVHSASQVKIRDNQFEQTGVNAQEFNSTVIVYGIDYVNEMVEITGNNFGGGTNVGTNIILINAHNALIDNNDFNTANSTVDINFAGTGATYNRIGPNNRARGTRGGFIPTNLTVADSGVGNYGVWRYASAYGLSNSWESTAVVYKAVDGKVSIEGTFTAGVTTGGTLMFTLPVGMRPITAMRVGVQTSSGAGHVLIATNGQVTVGSLPSNTVYFNAFTFLSTHEV